MNAAVPPLEDVFRALSDPTRRQVVERLGFGPSTVGELASPFAMALPSFMQHLGVLEDAGVVRTHKQGRTRVVTLVPTSLTRVSEWVHQQETVWPRRLDQLDEYLRAMHTPSTKPVSTKPVSTKPVSTTTASTKEENKP